METPGEPIDRVDRPPLDIRREILLPETHRRHAVRRPLLARDAVTVDSHRHAEPVDRVRHWIENRLPRVGAVGARVSRAEHRPPPGYRVETHHSVGDETGI